MDAMKRNESFVFYLQHNDEASSSASLDPNAFRPAEGEQEIARACKMVIYYPPFSDNRTGILGTLYCTTLRLVFVPATGAESETTEFRTSRVFASFKYETSLLNICQVQYASAADAKKLKPLTSFLQHLDQVVLVKIFCKDFRIFTFDFKSSEGYRALLNAMLRYAFPLKLNNVVTVYRLLSFPKNHHMAAAPSDEVQSFDSRSHWESELRRTGAHGYAWRVTHVNAGRRYIEGYPEYFVVPTLWLDCPISVSCMNWTHRRIPVWCWSSKDGCALLRSSTLNTQSEVTEKQWLEVETAVAETHPSKRAPTVLEANVSVQEVAIAFELLRKLCSADSGGQFWSADTRWLTEIEATGWPALVTRCLSMTEQVVTLINQDRRSVIFREVGNSDIACVISSLAQLCMDSFFRTVPGFAVLLQKEWIALAHPFAVRLFGLASESRSDEGIAPVFLLFLDCVHQLLLQNPISFAFSSHYLIALWDLSLTGLTRTFLFNNLREASNFKGNSMRSAWSLDSYFTQPYRSLFVNPLYSFSHGLEPLAERETPPGRSSVFAEKQSRSTSVDESVHFRRKDELVFDQRKFEYQRLKNRVENSDSKFLLGSSSMADYRFWDECYLRWSAPAQTLRGGRTQAELQIAAVLVDISYQLNELRYLREQPDVERSKFGQQLRHHRVQPINLNPDSMERMTSAFPFGCDTIPIPDYLYILPLRNELKQSGSMSTPRSALELATFDLSSQATALSCERLSVWGGNSGENNFFHRKGDDGSPSESSVPSEQRITRKKNYSVVERKTPEPVLSELKNKLQSRKANNSDATPRRDPRKYSADTIV